MNSPHPVDTLGTLTPTVTIDRDTLQTMTEYEIRRALRLPVDVPTRSESNTLDDAVESYRAAMDEARSWARDLVETMIDYAGHRHSLRLSPSCDDWGAYHFGRLYSCPEADAAFLVEYRRCVTDYLADL